MTEILPLSSLRFIERKNGNIFHCLPFMIEKAWKDWMLDNVSFVVLTGYSKNLARSSKPLSRPKRYQDQSSACRSQFTHQPSQSSFIHFPAAAADQFSSVTEEGIPILYETSFAMDEGNGAVPTSPNSNEAESTNDVGSCTASAQTEVVKNSYSRNESDTTDAAKTVDLSTAEASTDEYTKKVSIETSSVATPEPVHMLGQVPASPTSTASPSVNSAAAEEVERLRREAEEIKAEQQRLEEEIRQAKLKKEELAKEVKFMNLNEEDEDHIEIFCENPIDVMSAITEDHRTLHLNHDVEVMSQITEARTEARHFSDLRKKKKWMIIFACIVVFVVIAGFVGGVMSSRNGVRGGDDPSGLEGESGASNANGSKPTAAPTIYQASGPAIIDITDDDIFPTLSPTQSSGSSNSPSYNTIYASKVKIQPNNEAILNVFEVQVFDTTGVNVAIGKNASQSSTFDNNYAAYAVDGLDDTFSSTLSEENAWLLIDLGESTPVESITIKNYWCFDETDQGNCLARLYNSTLQLLGNDDTILATKDIGDTTGWPELEFTFDEDETTETSAPPAESSQSAVHNKVPTNLPSLSPVQSILVSTQQPSSTPTIYDPSCASDEGLFTLFLQFGADPSQFIWAVLEECTQDIAISCNQCYQGYEPYSSAVSHKCLALDKLYTFYLEDPAGDVWPSDSGFTLSFNGNAQSMSGNGGSMPETAINFGDGAPCPSSAPTAQSSTVSKLTSRYISFC